MDLANVILDLFTLKNDYNQYYKLLKLLNLKFTNDIVFWLFDKIKFFNEENEIIEKLRLFTDNFDKEDFDFRRKLVPNQVAYDEFILNINKYDNEFLLGKYKYFDNLDSLNSTAIIYIDTGSDFNENEKIAINYQLKTLNSFKIDLSSFKNIKRIRFDPIKQAFIKCKLISTYSDKGKVSYISNSDYILDEFSYFSNNNPYYILEGELDNISNLSIDFNLYFLNSIELNNLIEEKDKAINDKNEKIKYLEEKLNNSIKDNLFKI